MSESMESRPESLEEENARLRAENEALKNENEELRNRIQAMKQQEITMARVHKDDRPTSGSGLSDRYSLDPEYRARVDRENREREARSDK